MVKDLFKMCDVDGDGEINIDELGKVRLPSSILQSNRTTRYEFVISFFIIYCVLIVGDGETGCVAQ